MWDPIARKLAADAHTRLSRELSALRRRSRGEGRILRDEIAEATRPKSSGGTVGFYGSSDDITDIGGPSTQVYPWDTEIKAAHGVSLSEGKFTFLNTADWILLVNAVVVSNGPSPSTVMLQPRLNGATFIPPQARVEINPGATRSAVLVGLVQATVGDYMEIFIQAGLSTVRNVPEGSSLVMQRV